MKRLHAEILDFPNSQVRRIAIQIKNNIALTQLEIFSLWKTYPLTLSGKIDKKKVVLAVHENQLDIYSIEKQSMKLPAVEALNISEWQNFMKYS